jgi:hypothetical protein
MYKAVPYLVATVVLQLLVSSGRFFNYNPIQNWQHLKPFVDTGGIVRF